MVEDSITCGKRTFKFQHLPCLGRSPVDEDRKKMGQRQRIVM